jgi:hypothetical protein
LESGVVEIDKRMNKKIKLDSGKFQKRTKQGDRLERNLGWEEGCRIRAASVRGNIQAKS